MIPTHETPIHVVLPEKASSFASFVASLPSVTRKTVPLNWFLSWPHLSTVYSSIANFEKVDHVYYRRHTLTHADGGNNTLDFAIRTTVDLTEAEYEESGDASLPPRTRHMTSRESQELGSISKGILVVLIHGLAGGSHENYIRRTITGIFHHFPSEEEVSVVAFNARGCARSKVTSKQYWNAGQTDDLSSALDFLSRAFPHRKIMAVGYSLGANILCNYLAKSGTSSRVSLAVSVSNPWNLLASNTNLESYWLGRLYSRRMAGGLQRLFRRHAAMLTLHEGIDQESVMAARSLRSFDAEFTARAFGFESAEAYYVHASSSRTVHAVETDLVIIHARDDPMALDAVLPYAQVAGNAHLCMLTTQGGGHLGWYGPDGGRWFVDVILECLQGLQRDAWI